MKKDDSNKSPLSKPPLRSPAQSLIEYREDQISDKLVGYIFGPMILIWWAAYEWIRYFRHTEPIPMIVSFLAIMATGVCAYKIMKLKKHIRCVNRGIEGEKAVGQFLEQFRIDGYQVFHDIPGDSVKGEKFNIDHVLIGPGGVFTIETKYAQKPAKGQCIIERNGDELKINGAVIKRNPIIQAKAQQKHLNSILEESTGQKFATQPIVVYPGWYVKNNSSDKAVLVLNEKMIATALANSGVKLTSDKIHLAAYHLSRHIMSIS